ncbi:MAG: tripartite tricarboxylate transporter permease, partial [Deltaproteobacteria bacterium]
GNAIPTFISYALERKFSKYPEKFGTGVIEGVAGPEATNNAACSGHFIPLLSLGIPANPSTAILLGALMILGFQPGPLLIESHPELFWGLVASMYTGNVMLLVLNLPLIGLWVRMIKIPYSILSVLIILFCEIGAYSLNTSMADVLLMNLFGLVGYMMKRYDFSAAPLILAFILGPMLERSLRQSLILSHGSPAIFFSRPISLTFLLLAIALLISTLITGQRIGKKAIDMEEV